MKTKLTALAFLLLPTISTPTFAEGLTLTAGEFVQNNDGTVTHTPTGLIWQACSVGQTWDGNSGTCTGTATNMNYSDAMKLTSDFAGKTDWRVPNIVELKTLVDLRKMLPAINKSLFPQMPTNQGFVSSSLYSSTYPWIVSLAYGFDGYQGGNNTNIYYYGCGGYCNYYGGNNYVRLVRGQPLATTLRLTDFVDNKDGSVTHTKTGLTWQRCAVGQIWNDGGCDGKPATYKQADALKLTTDTGGKTDWRLPTYRELLTIVDYLAVSPATNVIVFPDAPSVFFWTSTQTAGDGYTIFSWFVDFQNGAGSYTDKNILYSARLVRGSITNSGTTTTPTGSVDLSATLTANPNPAKINQTLTYSAIVTNKGKATATGTTLTFYVAPKFMSYTASSNGCELKNTGLSVVCNIGDLAAGANVTKTMNVIMQKSGGVSSSVFAKSNEADANPADNIGKTATGVKKQ